MIKIAGLAIGLKTAVAVGTIGLSGAAVTVGAILPSHASGPAKTAVSHASPSPNPHAAFGQCVAANAKTASTHHAKGWNPTQGCTKHSGGGNSAAGRANAATHANPAASTGLAHASAGKGNATKP